MNDDKQMHKGNWTCSKCGSEITELPFEPDPDRANTLKCLDCHKAGRDDSGAGRERAMHTGDWTCCECGGKIDKLPFEPRETGNLKCRDCFRK